MALDLLKGIRVLDLSQWLPGPFAAQILSDLGADVVKVEPPSGDPMRGLGPKNAEGLSRFYQTINAGKRVIRLDLKDKMGHAALEGLVAKADVLLESFRPGALEKLGLGRDHLKAINPRLVHTALSGYGQTGPYRLRAGHDLNYMAIGGALWSSGKDGKPVMSHPPVADYSSALQAALGAVAALFRRERSGEGAFIDVSLMETVLAWQAVPFTAAWAGEALTPGEGMLNGGAAFYNIYETADGRFLTLGEIEEKFWTNFCRAVGREDWIARQWEAFPQIALIEEVAALFGSQPLEHWTKLLATVDVCAQPVLSPEEVLSHPHIAERGWLIREQGTVQALFTLLAGGEKPAPRDAVKEISTEELAAW